MTRRYGLCRRCWRVPLVSGMWAWVVVENSVVLTLDGKVRRVMIEKVLWCDECGSRP